MSTSVCSRSAIVFQFGLSISGLPVSSLVSAAWINSLSVLESNCSGLLACVGAFGIVWWQLLELEVKDRRQPALEPLVLPVEAFQLVPGLLPGFQILFVKARANHLVDERADLIDDVVDDQVFESGREEVGRELVLGAHRQLGAMALKRALARGDRDWQANQVKAVTRRIVLIGPEVDPADLVQVVEKPFLLIEINCRLDAQTEGSGGRTGSDRAEVVGCQAQVAERALVGGDLAAEEARASAEEIVGRAQDGGGARGGAVTLVLPGAERAAPKAVV